MKISMPGRLVLLNGFIGLSAVLAIYAQQLGHSQVFAICKPLTTILVIAVVLFFGRRSPEPYFYSSLFALLFCLAGDVFLLKESRFLYGLASFLVAHLLFAYSFTTLDGWKFYKMPIIILLVIGFGFYGFMYPDLGKLAIPVAVYVLVILLMSWQGLNLYLWKKYPVFWWIGLGVVLFLISDSLLAVNKFTYAFSWSGIPILTTYWLSIAILANAGHFLDQSKDNMPG
ncbi:MAG: lysoplasmalogenase [Bacteroidota bacterium]